MDLKAGLKISTIAQFSKKCMVENEARVVKPLLFQLSIEVNNLKFSTK